jgi:glycosyltransferase involved in cell wall biosynthesis
MTNPQLQPTRHHGVRTVCGSQGEPPVQSRPLQIVFASHTYCGGPFVVGSHHLAREVAALGHGVVHLSTPITALHFLRPSAGQAARERAAIWRSGGRIRDGQFLEYVPFGIVPWMVGGPIFEWTGINLTNVTVPRISHYFRQKGFRDIDALLVDQPVFVGLDRLISARATIVRSTDVFGTARGTARQAAETALARTADGLVGTSHLALDDLRNAAPEKPAALIENGVQVEHFAAPQAVPSDLQSIPRPILVFAGAIDERFDMDAVFGLARKCPEFSLVIIGPKPAAIGSRPFENVRFLGAKPYGVLPGYLQHADLGLLPFNDHPSNAARSPMKLYEYAAAGLQVVARRTPELARRNEPFVHFYDDASELAAVCDKALASPPARERVAARAAAHSWQNKAGLLLQFVRGLLARKEQNPVGATVAERSADPPSMRFGPQTR